MYPWISTNCLHKQLFWQVENMLQYIADKDHYTEVLPRCEKVKHDLWIGTADLKDLPDPADVRVVPLVWKPDPADVRVVPLVWICNPDSLNIRIFNPQKQCTVLS